MEEDKLKAHADDSAFDALTAVVCKRLNHIVDRRPDVVQAGRSRVTDFAAKVGVHYNTANRLLRGEILPSAVHLCRIAKEFEVSESWLLGRGSLTAYDAQDESLVKIHVFNPHGSGIDQFATVPAGLLPRELNAAQLLFARTRSAKGNLENVIVKLMAHAHEDEVHLVYDPTTGDTSLRRINIISTRNELLCLTLETGLMKTLKISDVVLGEPCSTSKPCILGPVVARIKFGFGSD